MLLREHLTFDQAGMMVESAENETGQKNLYMKGIFIQGDVKNLNERIYPVSEIRNAVENVNAIINRGESVCGELDHPQELTINLNNIACLIEKMWMENSNGMGKLRILPTPSGNIARTLIESGVRLGVSSRGSGSVDHRGYVSDFDIVTVDIVMRASAQNAYPSPVYEAFNTRRGGVIFDLATAVRHDPLAQKYLNEELKSFIDKLN